MERYSNRLSQDKCIHQLFEQQVELNPDAVAVVFEEQELTYRELNSQANKLAHYLRSLGVSSEVLVGICVERSIEMIVGLLGILKAGGAYVPIDPTYPRDRIAYMLENSQVPILLTQNHLKATLPEYQGHTISLDSDWDLISTESQENPITGVTSQNLAYIIYTSGSTGQPKGVLVAHQGLCNLASQQIRLFEVKQTSRVLQFFSISFDGAIWEIVMALCSGARLCLIPPDSVKLGSDLNALLQKHSITHMTLVPSALATLSGEDLPTLQTIIVAGEACSQELVQKWSKGRIFFNAYGPTEYTVCATVTECSDRNQKPTIGRPIANTQIYILDNLLQPVPIGVPGELHIGGLVSHGVISIDRR
jgi:amino acid adenylation domain-containing protein